MTKTLEEKQENISKLIDKTTFNKYESVLLLKENTNIKNIIDEIIFEIKKMDFIIYEINEIGLKILPYKILNYSMGYYIEFKILGNYISKLEKYFRENSNVLKFLALRMDEGF